MAVQSRPKGRWMVSAVAMLTVSVVVALVMPHVAGHGMVLDPVCRQSRWRYNESAPTDYNDNQVFCGGFGVQFGPNGGRCGQCGDNWKLQQPRAHELGGKYGEGVVVRTYPTGSEISVTVQLTANHMGKFVFRLCNLDANAGIENEQCFERNPLRLVAGPDEYVVPTKNTGNFQVKLQLPAGLTCEHCVLRWTYVAGNNWGKCETGGGRLGCGPQEHFRSCSDIRITSAGQ